jgi:hypothetical protein
LGKVNSGGMIVVMVVVSILAFVFLTGQSREQTPEESVFTIGVFSHSVYNLSYIQTAELARAMINNYCEENDTPYFFEFIYNYTDHSPSAVDITDSFHNQGIDIIIGYGRSSMINFADKYAQQLGVVMVSPSGENIYPGLYPHIFTLGPTVSTEARAASWLVRDFNITRLVVFKKYSFSGISPFLDGFIESTEQEIIVETVPYAVSNDYTIDPKYIEDLEVAVTKSSQIGETGILFVGDIGLYEVMNAATWSKELSSVCWFANYEASFSKEHIPDLSPDTSLVGDNEVKVYLLRDAPLNNSKYNRLNGLFEETYNDSGSRFQPYLYDSLWVTALTLMEVGSTYNETVIAEFPAIASDYEGVTGRCQLDEYNQRYSSDYDIICYSFKDSELLLDWLGTVDSDELIIWFKKSILPE